MKEQIEVIDKTIENLTKVKQIIQKHQWDNTIDETVHRAQGYLLIAYGSMSEYRANQHAQAK